MEGRIYCLWKIIYISLEYKNLRKMGFNMGDVVRIDVNFGYG